ncbi:Uncharacterized protein DBV15_09316 [Temnothorax longispinosus]|uniref:Uncharacterized protein n=1 Tax=Temnothorax longispinosus TaxID=300112 RepID=A0A4S2JU36_9HYME|nr:Uncharacterized protein DBV15_09316 [Temnothorax longispinosus]
MTFLSCDFRVCKNLEKIKIRIRNYYKQRSNLPEWYMNRDPFRPELQELPDLGQGRLIFIMRITLHDPRRHQVSDIFKVKYIEII